MTLTAIVFENGPMQTPTKLRIPTIVDSGDPDTPKCLLYVPECMPVRQYMLCTAELALCRVGIIGTLEQWQMVTPLQVSPLAPFV